MTRSARTAACEDRSRKPATPMLDTGKKTVVPKQIRKSRRTEKQRGSRPLRRWRLLVAVLAAALAGALVTAGSYGARWYADRQLDAARQQALAAAKQLTLNFVSISASTVDRDLERIVAGATGEFKDEFTRGMPQVRAAVVENNVESRGTVLRAGLVSADRDSAVALVAIDATVKNTEVEPAEVEETKPDAGKPDADEPARRRRRSRRTARRRASADPALRRLRRTAVALAIAVMLTATIAGTALFNHQRAERRDAAVRESTAAATAAAQAIFSYDYRTFDASVANGKAFVTGEFADEYAQTTTSLKSAAVAEQAVVHAQVSAIAVISATTDRVELLLYLNQYRRNINIAGEKVDQNRVVLTMVRAGGEWKVVKAAAV